MTVSTIVHRGTDTIGGTCIEIMAETGRLVLDLGLPLMASGGGEIEKDKLEYPSVENGILSRVSGLYDGNCEVPISGVLLSHAHPDHFGLLDYVHDSISIFMSGETKAMLEVGNLFYPKELRQEKILSHCQLFKQDQKFQVGCFSITPYLIDHSAFGASAFLIEVEGRRILYTGDLRAHGRKKHTFENLPSKVGHIDCMFMEGTTLGGKHHVGYDSEAEVEEGFVKAFSKNNATFVLASGSNIDRTVSLYRACKKTGKTLVIDLYQFYVLTKAKEFSSSIPPHPNDHLRVFFVSSQEKKLEEAGREDILEKAKPLKIYAGQIIRQSNTVVVRLSWSMHFKLAQKMDNKEDLRFIYSMWQGYLDRDAAMREMPQKFGQDWLQIHTSGHAWLEDLQELSSKIGAKMIIPIHTLKGDKFHEYYDYVVRINNEAEVQIYQGV